LVETSKSLDDSANFRIVIASLASAGLFPDLLSQFSKKKKNDYFSKIKTNKIYLLSMPDSTEVVQLSQIPWIKGSNPATSSRKATKVKKYKICLLSIP
jgi:hypothetical protein